MIEFHLEPRGYGRSIAIHIIDRRHHDLVVATNIVFEVRRDSDEAQDAPAVLSIPMQSAQSLMDQLWNCGVRPTEGSGSAGALAATEHHLADVRKVAADYLELTKELLARQRERRGAP